MLAEYRRAIAGAVVTLFIVLVDQFGVELPEGTGEALITLVVFGLGYLPSPKPEPPAPE